MSDDILEIYQGFLGGEKDNDSFKKSFSELTNAINKDTVNNITSEEYIEENKFIGENCLLWEFIHLNMSYKNYEEFEPINLLA